MDRLESMRVLLAAVDAGSQSAAGRKLGMPLATVSRKITELESALNTRLLIRSTRQLALTDAGRDYVAACRRILEDVQEAERAAVGEYSAPRGDLVITAPVVFGRLHVLPVLIEFLRRYPQINVQLVLGDRIASFAEDHVDVALRIATLPDSGLIATHLGGIKRVVCASPGYLASHGTPQDPLDLKAHQCISFETLAAGSVWRFRRDGQDTSVAVSARLAVTTAEAAVDAAIAGLGLTCVLSYQVEAALRQGTLVRVLERFEPDPVPVSFVYAGQGRVPLKLRAFLDFAAPRLRSRLHQVEVGIRENSPGVMRTKGSRRRKNR